MESFKRAEAKIGEEDTISLLIDHMITWKYVRSVIHMYMANTETFATSSDTVLTLSSLA